jgi:hypothetical protein
MQLFNGWLILSHYLKRSIALTTYSMLMYVLFLLMAWFVQISANGFALYDLLYCYHEDDEVGFCYLCALKEHMEESIQRLGSVLVPTRFKDNLCNIIWIEYMFSLLYLSLLIFVHIVYSLTRFTRIIFSFSTRTTRGCTWVPSLLAGEFAKVYPWSQINWWGKYCWAVLGGQLKS